MAWPFPSLFGALPKSAITSTHFSFSLAQGRHCPPSKGRPSVSMLQWRAGVCLPRVVGTPFVPRPDTTCPRQVKHALHIGPHDTCREQVCKARNVHAGSEQAQRGVQVAHHLQTRGRGRSGAFLAVGSLCSGPDTLPPPPHLMLPTLQGGYDESHW